MDTLVFRAIYITNNTETVLNIIPNPGNPSYLPQRLPAHERTDIIINIGQNFSVQYQNEIGEVTIEYDSPKVIASSTNDLMYELDGPKDSVTTLLLAEDVEDKKLRNFEKFLEDLSHELDDNQIVVNGSTIQERRTYNKARLLFNRRINHLPLAVVYPKNTEQVQLVYLKVKEYNLPFAVRSGGHDHEGECSESGAITIDMKNINHVTYDKKDDGRTFVHIGPGNRFLTLTSDLAKNNVMIAHGTCATVGIAGFTFGGGWGPWTRKQGMNCDRLVGATIILGDGSIEHIKVKPDGSVPDLLWALRGGGGMSYGIVTELVMDAFELPQHMIKFELHYNEYRKIGNDHAAPEKIQPTIKVLKAWEKVIYDASTTQLTGTNLQIVGIPADGVFDVDNVYHRCVMYGYWEGYIDDLKEFIDNNFPKGYLFVNDGEGGKDISVPYGHRLMGNWDRISYFNEKRKLDGLKATDPEGPKPYPPDFDQPAPHKISCQMAHLKGWNDNSRKVLLHSLTSDHIQAESWELGMYNYVTLGAIVGPHYLKEKNRADAIGAFPYRDKQYTIQYQTWWNEKLSQKVEGQDNLIYNYANRGLDWMQFCRDTDIPHASGSFISFKDASIPTETYFSKSYNRLIEIKETLCKDPYNHFRSRKTII